jgi:hypothetical protein
MSRGRHDHKQLKYHQFLTIWQPADAKFQVERSKNGGRSLYAFKTMRYKHAFGLTIFPGA